MPDIAEPRRFLLFLIKPSHYDDDGYVIQWRRSALPSNSLACLYGIAQDAIETGALGPDVDLGNLRHRRDQHPRPARRDRPADRGSGRARAGRLRRACSRTSSRG